MRTVLGPFHPHLENALIDEVRKHKSEDPLSPLLILVPSDSLRRRLKISFAAENHLNLLNAYVLTFHQLYLRLFEESQTKSALLPADDAVLEEALSHWIKTGTATGSFLAVAEKAGGCGALWQTLRDLKDGGVNPASLATALDEGLFSDRDKTSLAPLVDLYESFIESCRRWALYDYADFVSSVRDCVGGSSFLNQFERIFYYGFYDLTQIQLDVFYETVRHHSTTLFFPLMQGHPAWIFAQRFYERYLQGLASEEEHLCRPGSDFCSMPLFADEVSQAPPIANGPSFALISCAGPRDEILTVAKEILRLNRDEGLAFSEIGVVARTLEPYTDWIKEVFRDHRVLISTSAEEPLLQSPLAKAVILLLNLAGKDYLRSQFVDLVSSPFFNLRQLSPSNLSPRPDLWDILTRRLGITKGADEWNRLQRYLDRDLEFSAGDEESDEIRKVTVTSEQVGILWRLFVELNRDLNGLPAEGSWREHVESWKELLQKYLDPGDPEVLTESPHEQIKTVIFETLSALSTLDAINSRPSRSQFVDTLQRWLEGKSVPISDRNVDGVRVLDAMGARGSRFRTLFVLGLNEGLFPRTIREDAFLRDRPRRLIETVLGYKVGEKLAAFDEEKLLFNLLVGSASERLYCLYQRSDDTGRVLEPSWYLAELERVLSPTPGGITKAVIPRGIREKKEADPFRSSDFLLPEELAIRLSLEGQNPQPLLAHFPGTNALYLPRSQLLDSFENPHGHLSQHDGITGHLPEYWRDLKTRGVSPTSLERYARCPFQFFALNVLNLRPLKRPEEQVVVNPSERGKLVHEVLKAFFQELIDRGFFSASRGSVDPRNLLEAVARKIFHAYQSENPVGYRIVWELLQEEIVALLVEQTSLEIKKLTESGRRPLALEVQLHGKLPHDWPLPAAGLPIYGAIDRIDFDAMNAHYRVIDYKFTMRNRPSSSDNNLPLGALRGEKLQPPIYLLLAREFAQRETTRSKAIEASFYYLAPKWEEGPFLETSFSVDDLDGACGKSLRETIALLVRGVHDGLYFIHPGDACRNCEVAHVCRKNHLPTLWRTANDPLTQPHEELVKKTVPRE